MPGELIGATWADSLQAGVDSVQIALDLAPTRLDSSQSLAEIAASLPTWASALGIAVIAALVGAWANHLFNQQREKRELQRAARHKRVEQDAVEKTTAELYLDWVVNQHRFVNITGLRTRAPVEVELERVYVSLEVDPQALRPLDEEAGKEPGKHPGRADFARGLSDWDRSDLNIGQALACIDHQRIAGLVILGGPGTGKTTVLKYLALTYARGLQGARLEQPHQRLPLLLPLRSITPANQPPLAQHLSQTCAEAGCNIPADFFDERLQKGACIVLLDGLDEVADAQQRQAVARWIDKQWTACSKNPFVITCRTAGFEGIVLPPKFLRLDIRDFSDEDVAQFAGNWCLAVETMLAGDSEEARQEARRQGARASADLVRAVQANERIKRLAVNPLMLSIIALVHRYRARLPDRRVDLYAECVEVLLGHWDEAKDLPVPIPPGKSLRILQPLALWMHEHIQGEGEEEPLAHRREIEPEIARHLPRIEVAADQAGAFLDSIRQRSGLLVERGPDVFGFQHQTFQEYLAARELAQDGDVGRLLGHLGETYWQEVLLLYAGLRDPSPLLEAILARPDEEVIAHWPLVLQLQQDALELEPGVRQALQERLLAMGAQKRQPEVAVRLAGYLRQNPPELDLLIQVFEKEPEALFKGHLALVLGETGDPRAVEVLRGQLNSEASIVRSQSALALDLLGYEDRGELDQHLMVQVPAGAFVMGSDKGGEGVYDDETPAHSVHVDGFEICRYPLTNFQYRAFLAANPGHEAPEDWTDGTYPAGKACHPVVHISWEDAQAYAQWISQATGRTYRLPTEAEWEKAARGSDGCRYPWGDDFDKDRCNTREGGIEGTTPVGSYPGGASPYGVMDMAGNVWEWCADWYDEDYYKSAPERNPEGPETGEYRVLRGGCWLAPRSRARCACRYGGGPGSRDGYVGVRFSRML